MNRNNELNVKITLFIMAIITSILAIATVYFFIKVRLCYSEMDRNTKKYFEAEYYTSQFIDAICLLKLSVISL